MSGTSSPLDPINGFSSPAALPLSGGTPEEADQAIENRLAMVRLGMATALYYALRTKHPPTAAHSLRVAVGCSLWAERMRLPAEMRDRIEVAALLHDIGKIGIPDNVLRKPGKLSVAEQLTMDLYPRLGCEILSGCTNDAELLSIVRYSHAWFDSRRNRDAPRAQSIPLGARMLAIVGAVDAMTTDQVYRPAMSRERAISELMAGSGTQFDPELVHDYCRMVQTQSETVPRGVVTRWLQQLSDSRDDGPWGAGNVIGSTDIARVDCHQRYHSQLFDHMHDGVVFVDADGIVIGWNRALERLSGVMSEAACEHLWTPELIELEDSDDQAIDTENCPVYECLRSGVFSSHQLQIRGREANRVPVHVHISAVSGRRGETIGALAIFHDASRQTSLEERLVALHEKATKDALTGVDNRGQFDRALAELTDFASSSGPTFSLIICDIDRFKQINDVHGHQAGDEALVQFARVLQKHAREGDLVCRYGGEEFVVLSPSSDNPTATRRAEAIRKTIEQTPVEALGGAPLTASFGVTEYQSGDSPETVLARADRALLRAKDTGRNRVVQLGAGRSSDEATVDPRGGALAGLMSWWEGGEQSQTELQVHTPVPRDLAIEKLRGFIADHSAEVLSVSEDEVRVRLNVLYSLGGRRRADHRIGFEISMQLEEQPQDTDPQAAPLAQTVVHVQLWPIRQRDRRLRELASCIDQVIASLKSYLVGSVVRSATAP
ncbi:sensor domain-containing diguanylate cyclase/phosphohydrolase [Roseimaritima sediminicola]|uniref:sensor domain-containing diguanylate cyclase/phosphohydrolase n=1 Tax=Roseimaritima sediminicola TaxID=2662066 RepID=UPI0012982D05|nr:diguanylate cyclase [Roseimaritima sediminicola]